MVDKLQFLSYNCKGLTDPSRAVAIKNWIRDNGFKFDAVCLQEIKCDGSSLSFNLKRINSSFSWFSSKHETGKGGTAIGISRDIAKDVMNVISNKEWVCIQLGGELNVNLISVYAPCSPRERAKVWEDISSITGNSIMCGDFNNVEFIEDRYLRSGYVLQGLEEVAWTNLAMTLDLTDVSTDTGFSWTNKQSGEHFRAARLDRVYFSEQSLERWPIINCSLNKSILISDHYPLLSVKLILAR